MTLSDYVFDWMRHEFAPREGLVIAKVASGSADASLGPAMSAAQCEDAMAHGAAVLRDLPGNVLLLGEMGIGNTSAASLLMSRLAGVPLADCVGRGTGLDDAGLGDVAEIVEPGVGVGGGVGREHARSVEGHVDGARDGDAHQ